MKTVKTFGNLSEAGFAGSLLEAAGIPALLAGEQSFQYVAGVAVEGIRLQVEDADYDKALRVLEEGPDAPAPPVTPPPNSPENTEKIPVGLFVAVVVALIFLGIAVHQYWDSRRTEAGRAREQTVSSDENHDGKPDHFYTYRHGKLWKVEADRNYDGRIDEWVFYDQEGQLERMEFDENFDGHADLWYYYQKGLLVRQEQDTDFNSQPDWFYYYENEIAVRADCRPNGSNIVVRRQIFEHGVLSEELVDEDGDGKFDYKIHHDPFGGTSERISIEPAK